MNGIATLGGRAPLVFAFALLGILAIAVLALLLGLSLGRRSGRLEAERGLPERLRAERDDAVKRSRAVITGQVAEQIAPYLPGFPFDPNELRFIGKPIDFIAFKGATTGRVEELVFIEVKSGGAGLSGVERSLRDAVQAGKVRWLEYRMPE